MARAYTPDIIELVNDAIRKVLTAKTVAKTSNREASRQVVQLLKNTIAEEVKESHLRTAYIPKIRKEIEEDLIIDIDEEKGSYEVLGDKYVWELKDGEPFAINIKDVDQIFFEYSSHGKKMSVPEIREKHNLKINQWNSLKARLQLYRTSDIFSPYTIENTPEEDRRELIADRMRELVKTIPQLTREEYNKTFIKESRKAYELLQKRNIFSEIVLEEFAELLPKKPRIVFKATEVDKLEYQSITALIADIHYGASFIGSRNTKKYNTEIAKDYLKTAAQEINKMGSKKVNLTLMGDLVESISGLSHPNSWQSMEFGMYGANVMYGVYDLLTWFLGEINNLSEIDGLTGNHDRIDSNRKIDPIGQFAKFVYMLLERECKDTIKVNYVKNDNEPVLRLYRDGWLFVPTHGHFGLVKRKLSELVSSFGDTNVFTHFVQAHLHTFKVLECTSRSQKTIVRSIFPGNFYSEQLGFHGSPGFTVFKNIKDGKPRLEDISF